MTQWRAVTALPILDEEAIESDTVRVRLRALLASLPPAGVVHGVISLSSTSVTVKLGANSGASGHEQDEAVLLDQCLDGVAAKGSTPPSQLDTENEFSIRPSPSGVALAAAVSWPTSGLDLAGLLSVTPALLGTARLWVRVTRLTDGISRFELERRLDRLDRRGRTPQAAQDLLSAAMTGAMAFAVDIRLHVTHLGDLERVRSRMFEAADPVIERVGGRVAPTPSERLLRGDVAMHDLAAALLPLAAIPSSTPAPIDRRVNVPSAFRPARAGQLSLGTGAGGESVGFSPDDLSQHLLVYGKQGFGKTTTMRTLLRGLATQDIPFLVVDPIKKDYHDFFGELAASGRDVSVLRLGHPSMPPFNPLAVPEGVPSASFGRVLAEAFASASRLDEFPYGQGALNAIFDRLYAEGNDQAPTFAQLFRGIRNYATNSVRGAHGAELADSLESRLLSVASGPGAPWLLGDGDAGLDWPALLARPTLITMHDFVDVDTRHTLMAFLLGGLRAYRQTVAAKRSHVAVFEEAHQFLSGPVDHETALVAGLAEDLATMRAQRQGIALVTQASSQLPRRLRELPANAIAHRVDTSTATELASDRPQIASGLARLDRGKAAVWFTSGAAEPTVVTIDPGPGSTADAVARPSVAVADVAHTGRREILWCGGCPAPGRGERGLAYAPAIASRIDVTLPPRRVADAAGTMANDFVEAKGFSDSRSATIYCAAARAVALAFADDPPAAQIAIDELTRMVARSPKVAGAHR